MSASRWRRLHRQPNPRVEISGPAQTRVARLHPMPLCSSESPDGREDTCPCGPPCKTIRVALSRSHHYLTPGGTPASEDWRKDAPPRRRGLLDHSVSEGSVDCCMLAVSHSANRRE